jgi:hypothetical protein
MGFQTVLGLGRRGYFIPHAQAAAKPGTPGPALAGLFRDAVPRMEQVLDLIDEHARALETIGGKAPPAPRWDQVWFPRLDAAAAYALTRDCAPKRIVEVGSGHSTRFLARAVADGGIDCRITSIDPEPRATLDGLSVERIATTVQEAGAAPFQDLASGDFLLIDSSHVLMPGTDVDFLLSTVLPAVAPGVLVHFHDVFLPDGYPAEWAWRGYNEQLALAALLQGGSYEILFSSHVAVRALHARIQGSVLARLPLPAGAFENGLWLRKRG